MSETSLQVFNLYFHVKELLETGVWDHGKVFSTHDCVYGKSRLKATVHIVSLWQPE